jgi:hypothetical protein
VRVSTGTSDQSCRRICQLVFTSSCNSAHLVEIDDRLPELVLRLVKVPHAHFSEVTRMVLVDVRSVMVLSTSHTATTWMLPVLAYTTVTSRDMATTKREFMSVDVHLNAPPACKAGRNPGPRARTAFSSSLAG